ncbi:hypothetical protein SteCoe_36233 [Stentor coeruleus]|uniref:Chorein N-terminal domain-containing protein n=1 Tax=Stentor coeruleus TaxID=5963 RepID=A0A1R2AQL2_9CILI|nr:hypothetical protein SteCoe_36233 [Stentor coeruleus]
MVIKSKIYDFLKKNLGEYLYGFQKNQLDVGLLSGHIDLVNVNFRPDKVNQLLGSLGLPITIKAGLMGKLRLKCHYTSFLTSPIELEIDELLLIFGPITHIARENKNIFEDNVEDALLQAKLQQKIMNSNKKRQRTRSNKDKTPILRNQVTPKVNKKSNQQASFKSEHHTNNKVVFEDETGDKKSFNISEKIIENEGLDKTVMKNDIEFNRKKINSENRKKIKPEKDEGSTVMIQAKESNDIFKRRQRVKNEEKYESYTERMPTKHDNHEEEVKKKEGILEKYFSKILKNLILTVKNVHIRYEDETYPYQNPFSIGFSLNKLEVKNISHEWVYSDFKPSKRPPRKNAIVKDISFTNFAMYIYSMASVLIPTSLWEATIHSEIGIFEAFPAYEVRDLIIQESTTLSKSHPSTFIEPTNISMCISFYEEPPNLRIAGFIDKTQIKFTASMAECVRGFFEYCTNVQIWPLVLRFRPFVRIPERLEKRERRKERKKRKEIIKLWFLYAFAFIKTKRAAIRYVKERKNDKETMINLERQEKIREKVMMNAQKGNKGNDEIVSNGETQKSSFFSFGQKKKIPGFSGTGLSDIVKDYNLKKTTQPLKRRPYDGEIYFPKSMVNSEIEINIKTLFLSISDEDTKLSLEIEAHDINFISNTLIDEMNSILSIRNYVIGILDQSKKSEIIRAGNLAYQNDSKGQNFNDQYAVKMTKVYRPGEVLIPNDMFLSMNMYEVNTVLSPITITYTHNTITQIFLIKEAIEIDKCFRENLDMKYIKDFNQHCKKLKAPKVFGVDFKKYVLCKQVAKKFVMLQKETDILIKELHANIINIMFDVNFEVQGGVVNFYDFCPNMIMSINFARNKFTFAKDKEYTYASALGFLLQSSSAPIPLHEFVTSVGSLFLEKMKLMDRFCSFKS